MNGKSSHHLTASPKVRGVLDEWSVLHLDQAVPKSAIRAVPSVNASILHDLRDMLEPDDTTPEQALRESEPTSAPDEDGVYQLGMPEPTPAPPAQLSRQAERGAIYSLEFSSRCPHCQEQITTVRVSRLLRTHVSFTSTLPRKGYVIVCPECDGMLSAELSGLI
jgi:hypothetical protein